jgi:hypothetical protein
MLTPFVLLQEVILETYARAFNLALLRYLKMSGCERSVRKKVSLSVELSKLSDASL